MAEKGILVADAASGESVACRDAFEQDDGNNNRIIQRVDVTKGRLSGSTLAAMEIRSLGAGAYDSPDLDSLPAEVSANAIDVGDKSTFVAWIEWAASANDTIRCVPVVYADDGTTILGVLEAKDFSFDSLTPYRGNTTDDPRVSEMHAWSVNGAAKIGLAILENSDAYATIKAYASVI